MSYIWNVYVSIYIFSGFWTISTFLCPLKYLAVYSFMIVSWAWIFWRTLISWLVSIWIIMNNNVYHPNNTRLIDARPLQFPSVGDAWDHDVRFMNEMFCKYDDINLIYILSSNRAVLNSVYSIRVMPIPILTVWDSHPKVWRLNIHPGHLCQHCIVGRSYQQI